MFTHGGPFVINTNYVALQFITCLSLCQLHVIQKSLSYGTLFEHFTSHEGEMQISLLKTMKENVCLARQDGDTSSLVWEGDLWRGKSAHVGLCAATASLC